MKERPMLFNAHMVRAILDGRKTQTRRVYKGFSPPNDVDGVPLYTCPFGQVGDQLWVRETWAKTDDEYGTPVIAYRSGGYIPIGRDGVDSPDYLIHDWANSGGIHVDGWQPSIHMPRWASRIDLRITEVRVQRLQDISRGDCMAEGCPYPNLAKGTNPVRWFKGVWESINGADSWASNPWVWAISFERVKP